MKPVIALWLMALMVPAPAAAQLLAAKDGPVAIGHHHLNVGDLEAHKSFWAELGGTAIKFGQTDVMKFPNLLVFLRAEAPSGGTKGSGVNHIGFEVPALEPVVAKLKAAGVAIVTTTEIPGATKDIHEIEGQGTLLTMIMGPDDMKVELIENRDVTFPIVNHHIHFATQHVDEMKAWYVKTFGAAPGKRGSFEAADLPGVNLTYSPSDTPVEGTQGRVLDHIGFEVDGLEAFCEKLEGMGITFDRPYRAIPRATSRSHSSPTRGEPTSS